VGSGWWGGWAGLLAAGVVALAPATPRAAELTGIRATRTERGVIVRFELTAPTATRVRAVASSGSAATRLYVDLAPGTSLGPRLAHEVVGPPPLGVLRLGIGDEGVLRVVLDLEAGVRYRLGSERRGRTVALALVPVTPGTPDAADSEARAAAARRPPPPRIVIDPGHGGRDPGAEGYGVEKDVTLAVAQRLAALLDERLDVDVALTRSTDATLTLAERTALANAGDADLFVSIHANASPNPRLRGIETYYLNNTDDRATIRLASIENGPDAAPPAGGRADLRYILSDLVQVGKMEESVTLARALQRNLVARLRGRYRGVVDLGVKRGPFYVLVGAHMPCVLVEVSFLTHPTEGPRLAGDAYQETIAEGLYAGIAGFLADSRRARTL
jgi:N-acetylmuramoyl-L-alanine amidase